VQLSQSEELQDLLWLWCKLADTSDSNNKSNLWLSLNKERASGLGVSLCLDDGLIGGIILVEVLLGVGSSGLSCGSSINLSLGS